MTSPPRVICLPDRSHPSSANGRRRKLALAVRAAVALSLSPALVANAAPMSGLETLGSRVGDEALAEMRGKFVQPGNVSYFGISMATSWQDADDITTSAILLFAVDFLKNAADLKSANPMVAVAWNRDCEGCGDPAMDVVGFGPAAEQGYVAVTSSSQLVPVGGLDSVYGAVQSQQIGGIGNQATNAMQIAVVPAAAAREMDASELAALSQSTTQTFADGSSIGFLIGNDGLAMTMSSADGRSAIRQSVDGVLNQAAQHVLINDDLNSVANSMTITVGIDSLTQGERAQVLGALSAMKGRF